jgi:hypothetical protein
MLNEVHDLELQTRGFFQYVFSFVSRSALRASRGLPIMSSLAGYGVALGIMVYGYLVMSLSMVPDGMSQRFIGFIRPSLKLVYIPMWAYGLMGRTIVI